MKLNYSDTSPILEFVMLNNEKDFDINFHWYWQWFKWEFERKLEKTSSHIYRQVNSQDDLGTDKRISAEGQQHSKIPAMQCIDFWTNHQIFSRKYISLSLTLQRHYKILNSQNSFIFFSPITWIVSLIIMLKWIRCIHNFN